MIYNVGNPGQEDNVFYMHYPHSDYSLEVSCSNKIIVTFPRLFSQLPLSSYRPMVKDFLSLIAGRTAFCTNWEPHLVGTSRGVAILNSQSMLGTQPKVFGLWEDSIDQLLALTYI